jgi:hypothetical protein
MEVSLDEVADAMAKFGRAFHPQKGAFLNEQILTLD